MSEIPLVTNETQELVVGEITECAALCSRIKYPFKIAGKGTFVLGHPIDSSCDV